MKITDLIDDDIRQDLDHWQQRWVDDPYDGCGSERHIRLKQSRAKQGLPPFVTDPVVLTKLAHMFLDALSEDMSSAQKGAR